jgi:hypothetical protein
MNRLSTIRLVLAGGMLLTMGNMANADWPPASKTENEIKNSRYSCPDLAGPWYGYHPTRWRALPPADELLNSTGPGCATSPYSSTTTAPATILPTTPVSPEPKILTPTPMTEPKPIPPKAIDPKPMVPTAPKVIDPKVNDPKPVILPPTVIKPTAYQVPVPATLKTPYTAITPVEKPVEFKPATYVPDWANNK